MVRLTWLLLQANEYCRAFLKQLRESWADFQEQTLPIHFVCSELVKSLPSSVEAERPPGWTLTVTDATFATLQSSSSCEYFKEFERCSPFLRNYAYVLVNSFLRWTRHYRQMQDALDEHKDRMARSVEPAELGMSKLKPLDAGSSLASFASFENSFVSMRKNITTSYYIERIGECQTHICNTILKHRSRSSLGYSESCGNETTALFKISLAGLMMWF
ncbi:uncharacterized protein V1513DRAFT_434440 [Lipomyces chichibuensis]|uniref:uncharacterized protein n=1 Tax=Lipomyces chichibuensis TaxID=1546026 RepID=UPI003342EDD7